MAFQSCPDMVEVVIHAVLIGKPIVNVLHAWRPGGYALADVTALAVAVDAAVGANYKPLMASDIFYDSVSVRGLANPVDVEAIANTNSGTGGEGEPSLAANASICITLRSGLTGRSARGRVYTFPPPVDQRLNADSVGTAYVNSLVTAFQAINTAINSSGYFMSVLSRRSGGAVRPLGLHYQITQIEARNNLIDSQRGRLTRGH